MRTKKTEDTNIENLTETVPIPKKRGRKPKNIINQDIVNDVVEESIKAEKSKMTSKEVVNKEVTKQKSINVIKNTDNSFLKIIEDYKEKEYDYIKLYLIKGYFILMLKDINDIKTTEYKVLDNFIICNELNEYEIEGKIIIKLNNSTKKDISINLDNILFMQPIKLITN